MTAEETLIEVIADEQHKIWAHWMKYLFSVCSEADDGSMLIPKEKVDRWQRQMWTPYADLTAAEQESDRHQALKVLPALNNIILALTDATERAEKAEAALAERDRSCVWTHLKKGWYTGGCDNSIYAGFFKFCPNCGHPVKVQP